MSEIENLLRDIPSLVNEQKTNPKRGKRSFAKENIGDAIRVKNQIKEKNQHPKIREFTKYPEYKVDDGIPLLIKFNAAQLALIQLHGLDGRELYSAALGYLNDNFCLNFEVNYRTSQIVTEQYNQMINFICTNLNKCFRADLLHERLNGYVRILGATMTLDDRLKNCPMHELDEARSRSGNCTCALVRLMEISRIQNSIGEIHDIPSFQSPYEIANSFIILLGTAVFYTEERRLCETNPRSFDVGTACRHMTDILRYASALMGGGITLKATSQKYSDGKGSKIVIAMKIATHGNDNLQVVIPHMIYSITYNLFGRMWLCGISGFNLKHNVSGDEYFGASLTLDGAPHLNPNRSIGLNMLASNDLPFIIEMRIWGDGKHTDVFNHSITIALRRTIVKKLVELLLQRNCEMNDMSSTGDLRTKIILPNDLRIDASAIETRVKEICDTNDAQEYRQLLATALRDAVHSRPTIVKRYLSESHTELKLQTLLRVRSGVSDDGYLLNRVIVFPWINIVNLDLRIKELTQQVENVTVSECDVTPGLECPSLV